MSGALITDCRFPDTSSDYAVTTSLTPNKTLVDHSSTDRAAGRPSPPILSIQDPTDACSTIAIFGASHQHITTIAQMES